MHLHLTLQPGSWPPQARRRIPCHRLPTRSTHTHTHSFSSRTCSFHPAAAPGVIEYWSASTYRQPEEEVQFRFKLDTGGWGSGGCLAAWPATAGMACLAWPGSLPGSLLLGLPCACLLDWCGACLACRKTPMTPCILLSFLHSLLHSVFPFHHLPLLFSSLPTPPLQTCTLWPRPRPPPTRWPSPVTGPSLPPCRQTGGAGLHAPFVCGGGGGGGGGVEVICLQRDPCPSSPCRLLALVPTLAIQRGMARCTPRCVLLLVGVPQLLSRGLPFTAQSMCSVAPPRRKVRVFRFATGKLSRTYDESLQATNELQRSQSGGAAGRLV